MSAPLVGTVESANLACITCSALSGMGVQFAKCARNCVPRFPANRTTFENTFRAPWRGLGAGGAALENTLRAPVGQAAFEITLRIPSWRPPSKTRSALPGKFLEETGPRSKTRSAPLLVRWGSGTGKATFENAFRASRRGLQLANCIRKHVPRFPASPAAFQNAIRASRCGHRAEGRFRKHALRLPAEPWTWQGCLGKHLRRPRLK